MWAWVWGLYIEYHPYSSKNFRDVAVFEGGNASLQTVLPKQTVILLPSSIATKCLTRLKGSWASPLAVSLASIVVLSSFPTEDVRRDIELSAVSFKELKVDVQASHRFKGETRALLHLLDFRKPTI